MFKDLKQFMMVQKTKKWRELTQPSPIYYDGLEPLHDRIHPGRLTLRITDIEDLSHDTKLFRFVSTKPDKPLAPFRAGQYIGLNVEINGVRTTRPYSLVSSPNQLAYYELGIKEKEGGFVSPYLLKNTKVGDVFEATEPMGTFYYNPIFHGLDLVFIAGGCGITPFISMLRDITEKGLPIKIWLLFGCLTKKDILFKEELEKMQKNRPNFNVNFILSEPSSEWKGSCGFISKDIISKFIGEYKDKFFYIVGNQAMYEFVLTELENLGVPKHRIIHEAFGTPDDITKVMGWPKDIEKSKKVRITVEFFMGGRKISEEIETSCIEPLLNSLERIKALNLLLNSGCRSGECALCRTKLISGEVYIPPFVTIREVDQDFGYIHPCISYPISDLHLDLTIT